MKNTTNLLLILLTISLFSMCKKDKIKSSENDIKTFVLSQQTGNATIDPSNHLVVAEVENGTALTHLQPIFTLSEKATCEPQSGVAADFSQGPVIYTVTAEDGSIQEWTVSVTTKHSSAAYILSFSVPNQSGSAIISDSTVKDSVVLGTDISNLVPVIVVSPNATITPSSGVARDFSAGPVTYTVTAEDGTVRIWTVTIIKPTSSQKDILTFSVEGLVGTVVKSSTYLQCEIDFTQNIKSVAPVITVSPGASILPASGASVDFSNGFYDYMVTADNGTTKKYRIYVYYAKIGAENPDFQYYGRIDFTNPAKPRFWASGVYIKAKFSGTYCSVVLNDENLWSNYHNYIEIAIDNNTPVKMQTTGMTNNIKVADNLAVGEHTITICKDNESGIGYLEFVGLRVAELLPLPPKPTRKIEVIGNSIACGAKSDVSNVACGAGEWYSNDNAYYSYGAEVARRLDAQYHLSSVSGIGLIHSCCDMTDTMPGVYGNISFNQINNGKKAWDFTRYIPDVVTISLGQNDGVQDSVKFCSAYVNFIGVIRGNYPDAQIICLTSPMGDATLTNVLKKYLTGIVNYLNTNGDAKVHKFYFSRSWNGGCDSHPTVAQHQDIAGELETEIKTVMGW
jgi:hypothetical protein